MPSVRWLPPVIDVSKKVNQKEMKGDAVFYVAKYSWIWRLIVVFYSGFVLYILLLQFESLLSFWQRSNWFVKLLMIAAAAITPVAVMETFITRTISRSRNDLKAN